MIDNKFHLLQETAVQFDNVADIEFTGNTITQNTDDFEPKITLNHIGDAKIETEIKVERLDENA